MLAATGRQMKPTNLEWLGMIPEDWDERSIGRETWVRARLGWKGLTASEYVDEGIPMLATPNIKGGDLNFASAARISKERYDESPEIMLSVGDVLLTKDGSTIGIVNMVRELRGPATVNGSIAVITPTGELNGRFLYWVLTSKYAQSIFNRLRDGMGVPHLFQRDINRITIPFPPLFEQQAIVDYLDRETQRIDGLIAEQRGLIETMRERRDAGWASLYETAKSAGRMIQVRRVLDSIVDGPFGSSLTSSHYSDEGVRVIRLGNIGVNAFRNKDQAFIPSEYAAKLSYHAAQFGDVIIAGLGDEKWPLGRATVLPDVGPAIVKADCYRARPNSLVTADYLAWALSAPASRRQIALVARGATRARLNTSVVREITIPIPNIEVQLDIVKKGKVEDFRIDSLIAESEDLIALSQERRAALITAAVTGQIDVRTAA